MNIILEYSNIDFNFFWKKLNIKHNTIKYLKMSNFQKVGEFHSLFEHPKFDKLNKDIFDNKKLVDLRIKLIEEEFNELKEAVEKKDFKEVADALSDILYVVYGAGHVFGINLDKTFEAVHNSNMTKACRSEEEAIETINYIKETQPRYKEPSYKISEDGKYYIIYDKETGKILKNKNYEEVNLDLIFN
jgi:predicted HAD superfamily Cof-like phosphohydrolase